MLAFLAVLALGSLAVNANHVDEDSDPDVYCVSLRWNHEQFEKCRGEAEIREGRFTLERLYIIANETCKSRTSIMQCMAKAVTPCRNKYVLGKITESSIRFCDEGKVDSVMANFLKSIAGQSFNGNCSSLMVNEVRNKSGFPPRTKPYPTTMIGQIIERRSYFTWFIDQFSKMDQTETIEACNGMTRQTVYGIMLATVSISLGWGFDLYPEFVNIVQPPPNPWDV